MENPSAAVPTSYSDLNGILEKLVDSIQAILDLSWVGLIDRTWAGRPKPEILIRQPADPQDFERTLEFARYVIGLVRGEEGDR